MLLAIASVLIANLHNKSPDLYTYLCVCDVVESEVLFVVGRNKKFISCKVNRPDMRRQTNLNSFSDKQLVSFMSYITDKLC